MRPGAALALVGSCAVLFGASYAAAELTNGEDPQGPRARPSAPEPTEKRGRALAFDGAERLPGLRERPRPKPEPRAAPAPVVPAPAPAPAPIPEPQPQPVSGGAEAPATPAEPDAGAAPTPDAPPSPPEPSPPPAGGQTDFYDSGG
jgi:hypothetical protein